MIKKLLLLNLAIILTVGIAGGLQAKKKTETIYLNLDFEETVWQGTVQGWYTGGRGFQVKSDDTVVYSGKTSLCIEGVKKNQSFGVSSRTFPIADARGKRIRLSGYIKTLNVSDGWAGIWLRVDSKDENGNHKTEFFDNIMERGPKGTTQWTQYVIESDVISDKARAIVFGTLMSASGKSWFDKLEISLDGVPYKQDKPKPPPLPEKEEISWLKANVIPFKSADPMASHDELTELKKMIGDSYIVALGESTHGTSEFFKMKHRLTRFLAEEMGFTIFAIEANMTEARAVNRYILTGEGDPKKALAGMYFWTWNTAEVLAMIEWMREYNKSGKGRIQFYGFDMQIARVAMQSVKDFVKKTDKDFLQSLENHYKVITGMWEQYKINRDRKVFDYDKWSEEAIQVYNHLKANEKKYLESRDKMDVAWAIQDANIVVQAAECYIKGKRSRDKSMAENLDWILAHSPKGSKIVTWAHNGHISRDKISLAHMGNYLHKRHGKGQYIIGFAFHEGTYTAWGKKGLGVYGTSPSEPGSLEYYFKSTGIPNMILDLHKASLKVPESDWLNGKLNFRSIGARAMDYAFSKQNITGRFDALVYFEKSTPSDCFEFKKYQDQKKAERKKSGESK